MFAFSKPFSRSVPPKNCSEGNFVTLPFAGLFDNNCLFELCHQDKIA